MAPRTDAASGESTDSGATKGRVSFGRRSAVFGLVGPSVIACLRAGSPWLDGLTMVVGGVAADEAVRILRHHGLPVDRVETIVRTALTTSGALSPIQSVVAVLPSPGRDDGSALRSTAVALSLGGPLRVLLLLRNSENGLAWLQWGLATTWLNDAVAYMVGPRIGGPRLPAAINSKKKWLAYAAGVVASGISGAAFSRQLQVRRQEGFVIGAVLGICGAGGDIAESALKRAAGVGDSGNLLPGYGGALDRLDSLLATTLWLAAAHQKFQSRDARGRFRRR